MTTNPTTPAAAVSLDDALRELILQCREHGYLTLKISQGLGYAAYSEKRRVAETKAKAAESQVRSLWDAMQKENERWRCHAFIAHQNYHRDGIAVLYGDDGEMSCNSCGLDFKRDTPAQIDERLFQLGLEKLARATPVPESPTHD